MRYRALGRTGGTISAISLRLSPGLERRRSRDWAALLRAGLEAGISGFHLDDADAELAEALAKVFTGVDRGLVFVSLRIGEPPAVRPGRPGLCAEGLDRQVRQVLDRSGLGYLDAIAIEPTAPAEPQGAALAAALALKAEGLVRRLGLQGEAETAEAALAPGVFGFLATPYNLASGWRERRLVREAAAAGVAVFATTPLPSWLRSRDEADRPRPRRRNPLAGAGTYAFLRRTAGWTDEEIGVAFALSEPALASVLVEASSAERLERLAAAAERDLPPGLGAQIEMARFSPEAQGAEPRRA